MQPAQQNFFLRAACGALALLALALSASSPVSAADPALRYENTEWLDVRINHCNDVGQPRVLLIGDSITRNYHGDVEKLLEGRAYVSRLSTSKCLCDQAFLDEVASVLRQQAFDVIHFNNGLHGWAYTEEEYRRAFPKLLALLRQAAPRARLIWATITPLYEPGGTKLAEKTERVKERNRIAAEIVSSEKIPVDDLFGLMNGHPEYYNAGGVHANRKGIEVQSAQVADAVGRCLAEIGRGEPAVQRPAARP